MVEILKPEIVKPYNYGTYTQESQRALKTFILDIKRLVKQIDDNSLAPMDEDIKLVGQSLRVLGLQFEMMLAYKFPEACDCTISELRKYYNIQI